MERRGGGEVGRGKRGRGEQTGDWSESRYSSEERKMREKRGAGSEKKRNLNQCFQCSTHWSFRCDRSNDGGWDVTCESEGR